MVVCGSGDGVCGSGCGGVDVGVMSGVVEWSVVVEECFGGEFWSFGVVVVVVNCCESG